MHYSHHSGATFVHNIQHYLLFFLHKSKCHCSCWHMSQLSSCRPYRWNSWKSIHLFFSFCFSFNLAGYVHSVIVFFQFVMKSRFYFYNGTDTRSIFESKMYIHSLTLAVHMNFYISMRCNHFTLMPDIVNVLFHIYWEVRYIYFLRVTAGLELVNDTEFMLTIDLHFVAVLANCFCRNKWQDRLDVKTKKLLIWRQRPEWLHLSTH